MTTMRIIPPAPKATGPVTPEGKTISAQKSTTHGLSGSTVVLSYENAAGYQQMLEKYSAEFKPKDEHEAFLIQQMADSRWRLDRLKRLEAAAFDQLLGEVQNESPDHRIAAKLADKSGDLLGRLSRYAAALERSYYRAHKELMNGRKPKSTADQTITQLLDIMTAPPRPANYKTNSAQPHAPSQPVSGKPNAALPQPNYKTNSAAPIAATAGGSMR